MKFLGISKMKEWFKARWGATVMDEGDLLGKMLYMATELASVPLQKLGGVPPFGVTLDSHGENESTFFPRDKQPLGTWDELVDAVVEYLERYIDSKDVGAIALVTELVSENEQSGVGVQVETRTYKLFVIYPYVGTGKDRKLGECNQATGLLVGPLLTGRKGQ